MDDEDTAGSGLDLSGIRPYLADIKFPISKTDLLATLRTRRAPEQVLILLGGVHLDTFDSPMDVIARVQPR